MNITIPRCRAIVSALLLAATTLLGMATLSPILPRAHANSISVISTSVVWADYPCRMFRGSGVYPGTIVFAQHEVQRVNSTVPSQDVWTVVSIGIATSCPEGLGVLGPFVPDLSPHLGPWLYAPGDNRGYAAAYMNRGQICNVLANQGVAAAEDSMYHIDNVYPMDYNNAKRGVVAGTIAFCPWNLGTLRAYYGG